MISYCWFEQWRLQVRTYVHWINHLTSHVLTRRLVLFGTYIYLVYISRFLLLMINSKSLEVLTDSLSCLQNTCVFIQYCTENGKGLLVYSFIQRTSKPGDTKTFQSGFPPGFSGPWLLVPIRVGILRAAEVFVHRFALSELKTFYLSKF